MISNTNYLDFDESEDFEDLSKSLNFDEFIKTPSLLKQESLESLLNFSSLCEDNQEIINSLIDQLNQ